MNHRSDPTASTALGSVDREWRSMARLALRIRESGDVDRAFRESRRFTGIFRRLLDEPTERLRVIAGGRGTVTKS